MILILQICYYFLLENLIYFQLSPAYLNTQVPTYTHLPAVQYLRLYILSRGTIINICNRYIHITYARLVE